MALGAAWGACDLDWVLFELPQMLTDLLARINGGIRASAGSSRPAGTGPGPASSGQGQEESGQSGTRSRPGPRSRAFWEKGFTWSGGPGPWAKGFRPGGPGPWGWDKGPGPKGPGHWGGGFVGGRGSWWPGPPPPPRGPKAGRGDVRAAILALLQEGPRNGYQVMSEIEERSNGAWRPSPGAVYPALSQLADEGLIVADETGGKRTFTLTDAGRDYLAQNPEAARGAWESAAQQEAWELPGLFAEAARLGSGIVQLAHAGTAAQVAAAERLLERTRRELYRILAGDDPADGVDTEEDDGQDS